MVKGKKKIKIARYHRILKRKAKKLNWKKIRLWLKENFRQHPFVLGTLLFLWLNEILVKRLFSRGDMKEALRFHLIIILTWLLLVILSNALREKGRAKWYLRKRFVAFMLVFIPPLGIILLWSGSQFKKRTKVVFTIIFGGFFIATNLYYNKKYEKLLEKTPFERIVEKVSQPKKKVLLKTSDPLGLNNIKLSRVSKRSKVKLAASEIAKRCSHAIVSIQTRDKDGKELGMASGFIISEDGLIVTNFHVLESARQVQVKIGSEVFEDAYFVKGIPEFDIAIIKINSGNLPVLKIGDSDHLINGQFLIVLGNPWGLERSVSSGLVSAIRSKGPIKLIQMTAPVSPGSSGGPVLNEYGEVVGITTLASIFFAQNLNFAIPINYLNELIKKR
jgi:hypothetical protein